MTNLFLKPDDLKRLSGRSIDISSPMFKLLPQDVDLIVGADINSGMKIGDYLTDCSLCNGTVLLDSRDKRIIEHMKKPYILCPECFFKMEPKEQGDE